MTRAIALPALALMAACTTRPQVILTDDIGASTQRALGPVLSSDTGPVDPRTVGTVMLIELRLPPAGSIVGGHYEGTRFNVQTGSISLTDAARERWARELRLLGDSVLRGAGFLVRAAAGPTSDATALRGVRLSLAGRMDSMVIRSVGRVDPRVRATVRIEWQLIDLARGSPAFLGRTWGNSGDGDSIDAAVRGATRASLLEVLSLPAFRAALPRRREAGLEEALTAEWARELPRPGDTVRLAPVRRRPDQVTHALAGMIALRDLRDYRGSALVLTADGLAIAPVEAAQREWLFARFSNGVERPVRVLRAAGELALLEVSCPGGCPVVAWDESDTPVHGAEVFVVASRSLGIAYLRGTLRQRTGHPPWNVRAAGRRNGGEAIVSAEHGAVTGVATRTGVLPLRSVFALLTMAVASDSPP